MGTGDPSLHPSKEPWVTSQNAAAIHFYQNHAQKYDRVSTIDFDEFYFSKRYGNIKDFLQNNNQDTLLLGCKFFESVFLNINQGPVTQKNKCLDKFSRVGPKYIFNPQKTNLNFKFSPHYPPSKNKIGANIKQEDLCFYHYKINENAKVAIECHGKQKMDYTTDESMALKSQRLKDYNFIDKPETKQNLIDSEEDVLGLNLFNWDKIL